MLLQLISACLPPDPEHDPLVRIYDELKLSMDLWERDLRDRPSERQVSPTEHRERAGPVHPMLPSEPRGPFRIGLDHLSGMRIRVCNPSGGVSSGPFRYIS